MAQTIAVIDDDPGIRAMFREILTEEGYTVQLYAQPPSIAEIARLGPDLLLVDVIFGGQPCGLAFARAVRATPALAMLPLILCTASLVQIAPVAAEMARLTIPVLAKPFEMADMLDMITAALLSGPCPPAAAYSGPWPRCRPARPGQNRLMWTPFWPSSLPTARTRPLPCRAWLTHLVRPDDAATPARENTAAEVTSAGTGPTAGTAGLSDDDTAQAASE